MVLFKRHIWCWRFRSSFFSFFFLQARFTTLKVTCLPVDVHPQSMLCIDFKSQLLIIICKIFLNEELILKMYNYIVTKCKKQNYLKIITCLWIHYNTVNVDAVWNGDKLLCILYILQYIYSSCFLYITKAYKRSVKELTLLYARA